MTGLQDDAAVLGNTFRRGLTTTLVFNVVSKGMGAASLVLLIRALSVPEYAFYTVFLTTGQLLGSAAGSGIRVRYLREEAEHSSRGRLASTDGFAAALMRTVAVIAGLGAFGAILLRILGLSVAGSAGAAMLALATLYALGFAATELAIAHYEAHKRFTAAGIVSVARAAAILVVSLLVWLGPGGGTYGPPILLAGTVCGLAILTSMVILWKHPFRRLTLPDLWRVTNEERWLSLYYMVAAGFATVDTLVAASMLSTRQVATLGVALRYLNLAMGAIPALNAILRVRTSQFDLVDSVQAQRVMLARWIRNAALPVSSLFLVALLLTPFALPMIDGNKFDGAVVPLQIYMSTAFAIYLTIPASSLLMARRRFAWLTFTQLGALVGNLIGDVAAAPPFGIVGIAAVSSSAFVGLEIATTRAGLAVPATLSSARRTRT